VPSSYLQALLLTDTRREQRLGPRWDDVAFTCKSPTIRDKVEGERTIPLTPSRTAASPTSSAPRPSSGSSSGAEPHY
jgi:hypothetical protein